MIFRDVLFSLVDIPESLQKRFAADDSQLDDIRLDGRPLRIKIRRKFELMTQCMASMIARLTQKTTSKNCRRILIECVEKPHAKKLYSIDGIVHVEVIFDAAAFWEMDNLNKKKHAINTIREALRIIAPYDYIDVANIEEACNKAEELNYVNEWYWKKSLKRKNMSVQVKVLHEVECVTLSMVFTDSATNSSKEVFLLSDLPSEWVYSQYFGKLEWVSDDTARLTAKTGQEFIATYK